MATPESKVKDKIKAICKARGAYYAMPVMGGMASNGTPDFLISYKGRFIAVEAKALLEAQGVPARVVSVPCFELFLALPAAERAALIGDAPARVGVEAAVRMGWDAIIGRDGGFVGMHGFGASGKPADLYAHFGITPEAVRDVVKQKLARA